MLERVVGDNSVVFYRSPLLAAAGVPHGFSTRLGGVSGRPFSTLNLGNPNGPPEQDDPANIEQNYHRLQSATGLAARRRAFAHQVHGARVIDPAAAEPTGAFYGGCEYGRGDALVSHDPTLALSVRTADCVPVLLAGGDGRSVAACHAGWRGAVAGVVPAALSHFKNPSGVIAAIGPAIGPTAFEVGPEVAAEFARVFGDDAPLVPAGDKFLVDLKAALVLQLRRAGVRRIDTTDRCTVTHADEFFSHRRDRGVTGRMATLIGAVA